MAIEDKGLSALYFSKEKREVPLSHYRILRSHLIAKSTFKDENHIDTVKPGTLLGVSKNGHWYFEDIKYNHLTEFLDQNGIHWNLIVRTDSETLVMPENAATIAKNQNKYELFLSYKGFQDFFKYRIDECYFILKNEENSITINLSKEWNKFLKEFREIHEVDHPLDI